jgi:HAD superfamily hydrolase (TIGR01509 family)
MLKPGIKAALFDLDGTLLDSMHVWSDVDVIFFRRRAIDMPPDYPRSISGMSYMGAAEYTRDRFGLGGTPEEIAREWTEIAREQYARRVELKPGARELLTRLRAQGARLAVVTTLVRSLYEPCLKRNGIYDMFDVFLSTDQVGSSSKSDGRIFAEAARRLGAAHESCAVFEDVCECIAAAKALGMQAYLITDCKSTHEPEKAKALADGWSDSPGGLLSN